MIACTGGCGALIGALDPSFVGLLDPDGSGGLTTIDNPPGHVIIAVANNAEVDERLIDFLQSAEGGGLILTPQQQRELRPRIRFRVLITFIDGQQNTIEFVDGSSFFVQPGFNASSEPDLNQNDLDNVVVLCDVARVQVLQPIEVFVPVARRIFEFVDPTDTTPGFFREQARLDPEFLSLAFDDVDVDGNVTLRRNIGIRDAPAPVDNPLCGSVVTIVVAGVLSVPFREDLGGVPGFADDDLQSQAQLGGRYEFRVSIR